MAFYLEEGVCLETLKPCIWMILAAFPIVLLDVAGVHLERSRKWRLHLEDSEGVYLDVGLLSGRGV